MIQTKMRSLRFRLTALFLCQIAIFGSQSFAQTLRQRLSLQMETSFNRGEDFRLPASISLGSEVRFWIANKFYAGLRLDAGLGSFGDNGYVIHSSGGFSVFNYRDASLATMSSLSVKGYYEFRLLKTRMFIGYGLGRFFGSGLIGYKTLPIGSTATYLGYDRLKPAWLVCRSIGIRGDQINFIITSNNNSNVGKYGRNGSVVNHFTYTLGFEIGNGKNLSQFKGKTLEHLPLIMLNTGIDILVPFGHKSGGASSIAGHFEPKIALTSHSSIGMGLTSFGGSIGYDATGWPFDSIYTKEGLPTIPNPLPPHTGRDGNELSLVKSITLFYDHYFQRKSGRLYLGGGLSRYRSKGRNAWIETDDFGEEIITPSIPKETALGYLLRLGYKTGSFRTGFNVNFVGKHIPFHVGFHMGIEPGFFKGDIKSLFARSGKV